MKMELNFNSELTMVQILCSVKCRKFRISEYQVKEYVGPAQILKIILTTCLLDQTSVWRGNPPQDVDCSKFLPLTGNINNSIVRKQSSLDLMPPEFFDVVKVLSE